MKSYSEIDLEGHFALADKGKQLWETIDERFNADLYILFPHVNEEYNYYALLYLDEYIVAKKAEKVVLITMESVIKKALPVFSKLKAEVYEVSNDDIKAIIKYYALYEFSTRLTIISLKEPYDTCGENLLGVKGVTKEDLLCFDIYRFFKNSHKNPPDYDGSDIEIMKFLEFSGEKDGKD